MSDREAYIEKLEDELTAICRRIGELSEHAEKISKVLKIETAMLKPEEPENISSAAPFDGEGNPAVHGYPTYKNW